MKRHLWKRRISVMMATVISAVVLTGAMPVYAAYTLGGADDTVQSEESAEMQDIIGNESSDHDYGQSDETSEGQDVSITEEADNDNDPTGNIGGGADVEQPTGSGNLISQENESGQHSDAVKDFRAGVSDAGPDTQSALPEGGLSNEVVLTESAEGTDVSEDEEEEIDLSGADAIAQRSISLPDGNHIYFYNIEGGAGSSDMILLESNGRWGLIDSGHRYAASITDANGKSWATNISGLSCQQEGKYGSDAMIYMIQTLGVNHLDFIIGTHSHSDHIGGIPEIAELFVSNGEVEPHSLIDEMTVYFYKTYHHTGKQDDDLGNELQWNSWHNQAFYYQAKQAIAAQGGILVDVSCGVIAKDGNSVSANQSANLSAIRSSGVFSDVSYSARSGTNPYDDKISFQWGDMKFDLYNLFAVSGAFNENVNSIATVITCNGYNIYLAGDMDTTFHTEQKLGKVIASDHGCFDLAKMSHHGIYNGSNSKDLIDNLKPKMMIAPSHWTNLKSATIGGAYSSVKYYASKNYGTVFYGVGMSDRMLGVDLDGRSLTVFNVKGSGISASKTSAGSCRDAGKIKDGWSQWGDEIFSDSVSNWYYFLNNKPVTGWRLISGKYYHFASDGFMDQGWYQENGKTYYLGDSMYKGWQQIDGDWYYFDGSGVLSKNAWVKDSVGWCYAGSDGKLLKSQWLKYGGTWYFLKTDGHMAAREWAKDSTGWYWMDAAGKITYFYSNTKSAGWQTIGGTWFYFNSSGTLLANCWAKDTNGWRWLGDNGKITYSKWIKSRGSWYYIKSNGYMAANEWAKDSVGWCCMNGSGRMVYNKWVSSGGSWYYIKSDGYMAANEWAKDSVGWCWMNASGRVTKSTWIWNQGAWYYLKSDGYMAASEWAKDSAGWHWMRANGKMAS